jgi:hypothetical protein
LDQGDRPAGPTADAVLPGFVKNHLGFSSFVAGLIISIQYFATLLSRPLKTMTERIRLLSWLLLNTATSDIAGL